MAFRFQSGDIKPFYTTGQLFLADRANGRAYAALSLIFSKSIECGRERERESPPPMEESLDSSSFVQERRTCGYIQLSSDV